MADRIVGISNHTLDTFLAGRASRPECDAHALLRIGSNAVRECRRRSRRVSPSGQDRAMQ
jgi:hypothetical protein